MIRKPTRLALAAAATFAASLGPAALAQASVKCQPHGSHTITQDSQVRVYGKNGSAYACYKGSGRTTLLQNASPSSDRFAVGGKWVGWSSSDPTDSTVLPHSIITVMRASDRFINSRWYPGELNETAPPRGRSRPSPAATPASRSSRAPIGRDTPQTSFPMTTPTSSAARFT